MFHVYQTYEWETFQVNGHQMVVEPGWGPTSHLFLLHQYAKRHPNSQDNRKSLLPLSAMGITRGFNEIRSRPNGEVVHEAQIRGCWWMFSFTSPIVCTLIGWVSILGAQWLVLQDKTLKAAGTVSESCSAWVSATTKHNSPLGLLCPNPWDLSKLMGQPRSIAWKHSVQVLLKSQKHLPRPSKYP